MCTTIVAPNAREGVGAGAATSPPYPELRGALSVCERPRVRDRLFSAPVCCEVHACCCGAPRSAARTMRTRIAR